MFIAEKAQSILQNLRNAAMIASKRLLKHKLEIETQPNLVIDEILDQIHCPEATKKKVLKTCDDLAKSLVKPARSFLSSENKGELWQTVLQYLAASFNTKKSPDKLSFSETVAQEITTITGQEPGAFAKLLKKASNQVNKLMTQLDQLKPLCVAVAEESPDVDTPE